jgi:predicted RNase H-related nuclease YkuK (DUF458 family)
MKLDLNEVKEFVNKQGPNTKVYIGVDSQRIQVNRVFYAVYTSAVVVHIDGNSGAFACAAKEIRQR